MPTIIITNPMRALQLENQRLRRELETLQQRLAAGGGSREIQTSNEPTRGANAAAAPASASSPAARPAPSTRTTARLLVAGSAPRPLIHLRATNTAVPSAAVPSTPPPDMSRASRMEAPGISLSGASRAEPESLDDAAMRFRLLELD